MAEKNRLDTALYAAGLCESREKAKALIQAGSVYVNQKQAGKASMAVNEQDVIEVRGEPMPFVSRGGLKLQKAVQAFFLSLTGAVCADIGASTGGFTDCMLQEGAARVYAVDVGSGQLAEKLRRDGRVINLEQTNFRYVTQEQIPELLDFASVDVSFISLKFIFSALFPLLKPDAGAVCLVKPQFEAGQERIGKNGVVKDARVHAEVVEQTIQEAEKAGFSVAGLDYSPIKGPKGNI